MSTFRSSTPPGSRKESFSKGIGNVTRPRVARRARVALACQRCKTRKQKCNGKRPTCDNCSSFDVVCEYIEPPKPVSRSQDEYYKAAEDRVAELEAVLRREGIADEGETRWRRLQSATQRADSTEGGGVMRPAKRSHEGNLAPEPSSVMDGDNGGDSGGNELRQPDFHTVVSVLRDLSLEASGGYIGASSSITLSRMVGSLVRSNNSSRAPSRTLTEQQPDEHLSPKSYSEGGVTTTENWLVDMASIPADVADRLLRGYLKHISTRWPILHSTYIRNLHSRRAHLTNSYEKSILHLVYASGGRFLETTGEPGAFHSERHHLSGMQYLDELIQCHDVRSVQVLIMLGIYSLRDPKGPGAWTYVGLAMRTCIDLGMHRRAPVGQYLHLENEMRKRIFWTCYCLDRQISIVLGRPFAISDRDIDAELPLDVDESVEEDSVLEQAYAASQGAAAAAAAAAAVSTSLSVFIHICRLRRIESQIQQCIYRVDETTGPSTAEVDMFLRQLDEWKEQIPRDARHHSGDKPTTTTDTMVIDGYGYYMVYYYKCLRFLLHPLLSSPTTHIALIKKCAKACGGVCQTYKKLHQNVSVGFSLMALHSVFLAGLTIVYCTWIAPQEVFDIATSNDMMACSIVLYIITERWPAAKKYRDMYEEIMQSVVESIEESQYEPRRTIKRLNTGRLFKSMNRNEEGRAEVSQMVADMVGEPMPFGSDAAAPGPPVVVPTAATMAAAEQNFGGGSIAVTPDHGRTHTPPLQLQTALDFQQGQSHAHTVFDASLVSMDDLEMAHAFDFGGIDMAGFELLERTS
ncbi:Zn2/Cys6 DNA-binding protein [Cladophialophora carrionii]|uniref:Zn2/Cys6 DNA-binding protein n=1 Tax=Cladophialophora carrionii TaxID=86049 RepID=A0A1C1C6H4_9EURO|nr:Zn2/Cys6 DNA-binding protein [Cladophialophora carrionii]